MKQTKHINVKMLLIVALALVMAFALVACNGDKKDNDDNSSDDVSETELYVGTGGIWDYMTQEDLELFFGIAYTEVQRQPNSDGYCMFTDPGNDNSGGNEGDPIGFCLGTITLDPLSEESDDSNEYEFYYYVFSSHENAVKYAEQELENQFDYTEVEYVIRNNLILIMSSNFPHIDDVKAGNYNLNDLPGKHMKMINSMLMKKKIYNLAIGWFNEVHKSESTEYYSPSAEKFSAIYCQNIYYENEYSNCGIIEEIEYITSGNITDEDMDNTKERFDQKYKSQIGVEYTEDSGIEVNKEESYAHSKLKTKPGFRFESEAEGEACVTGYYYDSEEGLDVVIPSTTPDGKTVTKLSGHYYEEIKSVTIPVSVAIIDYSAFHYSTGLQAVYYCGTEEQWNAIDIKTGNDPLVNAKRYYFSEQPNNDGNHWHWNAQHKPEVWAN